MSTSPFILNKRNSVANSFLLDLRNLKLHGDRPRFRRNLERLGEVLAYELSKTLDYGAKQVETPLGIATEQVNEDRIVLGTILRAGLPLHQGMLNYFDHADNAFVSAYRMHHKDGTFDIKLEYESCPKLDNAILIFADPMLATGASMRVALEAVLQHGKPKAIHIVAAIASAQGLAYLTRIFPTAKFWLGAVDEELTAKSYIVPGLGDAGDLSYGSKLQE